jgi:hypothetical protein
MIKRDIEKTLLTFSQQFRVVGITGPRQSGKTTLARAVFPDKPYVSLEAPDERERATKDPRHFLSRFPDGCIIDEVQRAPEIFSYLQEQVDAYPEPGRFIVTGSQQFGMMEGISQSLAGRIGMLTLLPFSIRELKRGHMLPDNVDSLLFSGEYPPVYDHHANPQFWYDSYINTYVERDVRQILNVQNTLLFQRFLKLCAANTGQLFNASRIGSDCGLNHGTISNWLSVLEASYIVFRLQPHYNNYHKRLVKTPKIYFMDVGVAASLLGIETSAQLATHPLRGQLFENWVIVEFLKQRFNVGMRSNLYFWRNHTGMELDLILDQAGCLLPVEIKSGATYASDWIAAMKQWLALAGDDAKSPSLIYGGDVSFQVEPISFVSWRDVDSVPGNVCTA